MQKELQDSNDKIIANAATISGFQADLRDANQTMEEMHETNDTLANENDRLSNQVALSESHLTSFQTELVLVKQKLGSAVASIALKDKTTRDLREALKGLEEKNFNLLAELKGKSVSVFKGR